MAGSITFHYQADLLIAHEDYSIFIRWIDGRDWEAHVVMNVTPRKSFTLSGYATRERTISEAMSCAEHYKVGE
jgi:hypothetical protein